jgi:phosphoglycolate phosphatase-like HAD superfamily hydrolase
MEKRLLLFDIDGTLIASNLAGRQVMSLALEETYGTAGAIDGYSFAGKTDLGIITDLLTGAGLAADDVKAKLLRLYGSMAKRGSLLFSQDGLVPCPGVERLLTALKEDPQFVLGLQTGNAQSTALLKLSAAGIDPEQFPVAAFGSDAEEKDGLLPIAWRRARRLTGHAFEGHNTFVIGDTLADVRSAQVHGAWAIAVASGSHSYEALAELQPDYLVKDLSDTEQMMKTLKSTIAP